MSGAISSRVKSLARGGFGYEKTRSKIMMGVMAGAGWSQGIIAMMGGGVWMGDEKFAPEPASSLVDGRSGHRGAL